MPKNRVEAISDGIFAVALTLLIVDMATKVPDLADEAWWSAFWPRLLTFVCSFFAAGIYWVAHHNELNMLVEVGGLHADGSKTRMREFLYANLLFLMFIVMLPFSAAVLGENWNVDSRLPCLVYVANLMAASLALQLVWTYVRAGDAGKLDEKHRAEFQKVTARNWIPVSLALAAAAAEILWPHIGKFVAVAVLPAYMLWTVVYARTAKS
jgi:uncharacterized membrane protein